MKRSNYMVSGLLLSAFIAGLLIWNSSAETASAQKNAELGSVVTVGEYNARDEFSLTQGGSNGLWNYGYSASDTDNTLTLFVPATDTDTIPGCNGGNFERWRINNPDTIPQIARHNPALTCNNIPSNALFMHPGFGGQRAVVRWTAPGSGTFQLTGSLQRMNLGATTDLKIIKNAATPSESIVFAGNNSSTFQIAYNVNVTVAAGDKLDFSVGNGDGSQIGDGSSIAINISQAANACLTAPANLQVNVPAENSPMDVASVNPNASLVGDATYTNMGKVGRGFEFDGAGDYVRIEDNLAQRPATAVTTEGWFKFDSVSGLVSLISKPLRNSPFNSYTIYLDGGQLRGLVSNGPQYTRVFSNFTPQTGVWHHLAFTYDLTGGVSTLKLYANGVEVTSGQDGTANMPIAYDANPLPLLIGGEYEINAQNFFLDGQADEVSVYGRALGATEIFNLVKSGSFGKCSSQNCAQSQQGLVSWLKAEGNALDSKGSNNGTSSGVTFSAGKVGLAFDFNGTAGNFVSAGTSLMNAGTADFAVDFWMQTSNNRLEQVIGKRSTCSSGEPPFFNIRKLPNGRLVIELDNGSGQRVSFDSIRVITDGVFHHIAVQRVGNSLQLYIDGVLDNSATGVAGINLSNSGQFAIGGLSCAGVDGTQTFTGKIDEVSVYNRSLTLTEIQSFFYAGGDGKCNSTPCVQSPNNLVSWFAGEGNALDSKSGNHGTLVNGATFQSAKVGSGMKFDGTNDFVEVPDNPSLKPTTLTLETWLKFDSLTSTVTGGAPAGYQNIIFKKNSRTAGTGFEGGYSLVKNPDNRLGIGFNSAGGGTDFASSTTFVQTGVWYHIVATHDGANIRLYVNGQLEGTGTATFPIDYGTTPLYLGTAAVPFTGYFSGVQDETSIYNRALTAQEVSAIYNAGSSGKCKPVAPAPASDQMAWFTGDGDTRDFTGGNPNGSLRGDAGFAVGKVGQAFTLDGNGDYIEVADDADHRPATQLTAEGWFKFNNFNNVPHMIGKGLRGNDRDSYAMWFANGNIRLGYSDSASNMFVYDTGFVPKVGEFNHYAMVLNTDDAGVNSNTFKLYVDGVQVFSGVAGGPIFYDANPHPLTIGVDINNDIPDFPLDGQIDEVSLYSRALSADEVAAIYSAGNAGKAKTVTVTTPLVVRSKSKSAQLAPLTIPISTATVTFANLTGSGQITESNVDLGSLPALPAGATATGLAYEIASTAAYQNGSPDDVQVCFNVPALANLTFANLRIYHLENGAWVSRTAGANASPNLCTDNLTSLSPFVIAQVTPTAAAVSVAGKVVDAGGRGLSRVSVTLTDSQGRSVYATTNAFGRYRFDGVAAGDVYTVSVASKRYSFAVSSQAVLLQDAIDNVDFMASEGLTSVGSPEFKKE